MKILLLSSNSIYKPGAVSNRMLCILKGIQELGHDITLLHSVPIDKDDFINYPDSYGKIKWFRSYKKNYTFSGKLYFAILAFLCSLQCYYEIRKASKKDGIYVFSTDSLFLNKFAIFLMRTHSNVKLIKEIVEYPLHERSHLNHFNHLYYRINYFFEYWLYDGYISISSELDTFLRNKIKRKTVKFSIVPICIETCRFLNVHKEYTLHSPYIAYCGDMSNNKDGVDILIEAFEYVYNRYPEYKLLLIGSGKGHYFEKLKKKTLSHKANNSVIFIGAVARNEIPALLMNANILALARPKNKQTQGGFPTKLGEYLITGNPVVVTNVSDIELYLIDEYDVFLASPDSVDSFARKLVRAIDQVDLAKKVGVNGKKSAIEKFSEKVIGDQIIKFFKTL